MTDKEMIDNPDLWPNWPFLPVKRRDNSLENKNLGVLIDENDSHRTVYHVYMFDLPKNGLKDKPKTLYPNTDTMIAEGWRID